MLHRRLVARVATVFALVLASSLLVAAAPAGADATTIKSASIKGNVAG